LFYRNLKWVILITGQTALYPHRLAQLSGLAAKGRRSTWNAYRKGIKAVIITILWWLTVGLEYVVSSRGYVIIRIIYVNK